MTGGLGGALLYGYFSLSKQLLGGERDGVSTSLSPTAVACTVLHGCVLTTAHLIPHSSVCVCTCVEWEEFNCDGHNSAVGNTVYLLMLP